MEQLGDRQYFERRADEELDFGDRAENSRVAALHYELAYRYALLCQKRTADVLPFPTPVDAPVPAYMLCEAH